MTNLEVLPESRHVPVIILNFNSWNDSFATIETIRPYTDLIWLIDNGSAVDRTLEAEVLFPGLRAMRIETNLGWAGGYNVALSEAQREKFEYVYILNNDAVPHSGAVDAALSTISSAKDIAAVGSVILEGNSHDVWYDGDYVYGLVKKQLTEVDTGIRETKGINGAGFMLNLKAIASIGPFHEDFFLYHEETDWCEMAVRQGWRFLINGSSLVTHGREQSNVSFNSTYYRCRNRFLLLRRGTLPATEYRNRTYLILSTIKHIARLKGEARLAATYGFCDGLLGRFGPRAKWQGKTASAGVAKMFGAALSGSYDMAMRLKRR